MRNFLFPGCFLTLMALLSGCLDGPTFMKSKGTAELNNPPYQPLTVVVPAREQDGGTTGAVSAASLDTQVVQAGENSEVAGASVSFPPGSIAIDTEITLSAGDEVILDAAAAASLDPGNQIVDEGVPVAVFSSVALDTTEDFTVSVPLPSGSSLSLQDGAMNLAVIYRVTKVSEGADFVGLIPADEIEVAGAFARVTTPHFGTFQAVYTQVPAAKKEIAASAVTPPPPEPVQTLKHSYYVKGTPSLTFDGDSQKSEGLQAFFTNLTPGKVSAKATTLSTGRVVKQKQEE
jgi:hypothetical protein